MSRWTAFKGNWTPAAVGDASNFTDNGYIALQGGSTTQRINILEAKLGGLATASAPTAAVLARDSIVGATALSGVLSSAHDPATAALAAPPNAFSVSTTKPQRSSTLQLADLAFNAFGGLVRLMFSELMPISLLGNTASLGEVSISSLNTGTPGALNSHIIFEPL